MTGQPHSNNANMNSTNQGRVRSNVQGSRERSKRDKFIRSIFVCHAERGFTPGKQVILNSELKQKIINEMTNIEPIPPKPETYRTFAYNPTGNGISERINQQITQILRMYKGWSLNMIKEIIENRLNNMFHSTLKDIPANIVIQKLNGNNIQIKSTQKDKQLIKMNAGRRQYKYSINQEVLIRNMTSCKTDSLFEGPYKIISIDLSDEVFIIDKGDKVVRVNIKRVKPFWRR
ncbi:putative transposable element [Pseudoloma neurophilia]|uniref:Putative transposable element n=1 Tax=Pseudoloma neurophilia TaxID=146866 RepID=A0A0R0M2S5_9MICR|nr:putative transposable element [Pseudoloma neurophilia]